MRKRRRAPGLALAVTVLAGSVSTSAQAALITYAEDFTYEVRQHSGVMRELFLPRFDPSLGTLQGAEVLLSASYTFEIYRLSVAHLELSDEGSFGGSARGIVTGIVYGQSAMNSMTFRSEGPILECSALLSVHECEDSAPTPVVGGALEGSLALPDLDALIGLDETLRLAMSFAPRGEEISTFTDSDELGPVGAVMHLGLLELVGTVSVRYTYGAGDEEPVEVPTPSSLALVLPGLLGLALARRRPRATQTH